MRLTGKTARSYLNSQIEPWIENVLKVELSVLDPIHTFEQAHQLLRSIEEFINISTLGVDKDGFLALTDINIANLNHDRASAIHKIVRKTFDDMPSKRFNEIVHESYLMLHEFLATRHDLKYRTIIEASEFYQSRRRHFLNIVYIIPKYCQGTVKLSQPDLLRIFVHVTEFCLVTLTELQRQLTLSYVYPDYIAVVEADGSIRSNHRFDFLENLFTEPERISITDPIMNQAFELVKDKFIPMPGGKIFSVSELINERLLIGSYFTFFKHDDPIFNALIDLLDEVIRFCHDDYFISIPIQQFEGMLTKFSVEDATRIRELMLLDSDDFVAYANSYHPFIRVGEYYKSNVNLTMRFIYNYKNISLNDNRRFQIKSGFLFEDKVKSELMGVGFVIMDVKRIKRREFDVVASRDNVLFNFQCKNNFVDITLMEKDPKTFARKNRRWAKYYQNAIIKEKERQHLLIDKYMIWDVRHFVISRFPVITDDPSVILFKDLHGLFKRHG